MVYEYQNWCLYKTNIKHIDGKVEPAYFFSKGKPIRGDPCDLPKGYKIIISENMGVPYLVLKGGNNGRRRN